MFENILLEQEQEQLFSALVEANRNIPRDQRQPFIFTKAFEGSWINHPGLVDQTLQAYDGDVKTLGREGLLALSHMSGTLTFDITPRGFKYYEQLKQRAEQPLQGVEDVIRTYLMAERFQQLYSAAYQKWAEAEKLLWSSDSEHQLTNIGHFCREALQEFAATLIAQYPLLNADKDKAHTVARIKAVINTKKEQLGSVKPFLDALLTYWGVVNDLIQRQEHGGQKEGQTLVWEDGRRAVFQTAIVMFEIDSSLSRTC